MFALTGKTALVTGASGAIGAAIAEVLHQAGASVVLTGRQTAPLESLKARLAERAHVVPGDLGAAEGVDAIFKAAEAALGGAVDIVVNNAGLTRDMLSMRLSDQDWQTVLDVNLTACFRLTRASLKGMMKKRWGRVINITSVVGQTGNAGQANYAASKAGLVGMSKSIAAEVASRNITVNCVAPGFIATAMTDKLTDDQKAKINAAIPTGRMGTSADVAACVLFLASEEAAYVTGQTIHVNGGMAMV